MITFAGCDLTPTTASNVVAQTWWHGHRINLWDYQKFFPNVGHLPHLSVSNKEGPRIGVLSWPAGADRFASCCLIATGRELAKVRLALGTAPEAKSLVFDDGHVKITASMYLIGVHPISQRSDGMELYLLVLVDERFFWWMTGGSEVPNTAASWSSLFTQLFSTLSVSPTISTVPAAYLAPNMDRWAVGVQPFPIVIQSAAITVGARVVRQLDGTVLVSDYTTAYDVDRVRWEQYRYTCLAGGLVSGADIARGLPDSVDTVFFDGAVETTTLASLAPLLAAGVTGVFGRSGRTTADPAAPTAPQRAAWAAQAAADYYNWAFSRTDATLRGFQNVPICGLDDYVEWVHTPETMVTRILRPVWSDRSIYGESHPEDGTGTGEGCVAYSTECVDGFLVQYRCDPDTEEWVYDSSTGVPCEDDGGTGTGTGVGDPGFSYPLVFRPVTETCPIFGGCVEFASSEGTPDYTITDYNLWIIQVDATLANATVTLPTWAAASRFLIVKVDASANTVTILPNGADTINDDVDYVLTDQWQEATVDAMCADSWVGYGGVGSVGAGTVTSITVTTAQGLLVSGGATQTITTTGTFALTLPFTASGSGSLANSGTSSLTAFTGSGTSSGVNTGDQTITLTGAVTGSGTGSFATTIATPGTLTVATANSTATAHTHAITSSSSPGAAASLLATDASGIIGSTGTRIVKGWFTDLTATNAISGSVTGNAGTATALATGRTVAITGDLTYTSPTFDGTSNVTAAGTLATVATAGTTGGSTDIPVVTINVKGLVTSVTTAAVVAPAGTLTGATLASGVTASSLTSFGTSPTLVTPLLGTPASGVLTNATGTAAGLTAGNVTTNANLTGDVTSVGNAATLATVNSNVGTFGDGTHVAQVTVNAKGLVTAASSVTITGAAPTGSAGGDLTGTYPNPTLLATVATAGTTGSSTAIPVVTINAKGLTTTITTAAVIAPAGTLTGATLASGVSASSLTSVGASIALGTPASVVLTNATGTASGLTAGTATALATARLISGISFDGSANILLPATANVADNGNFDVWQRNTSFAAIANSSYGADRYKYGKSNIVVHTLSQSTDVPTVAQSGVFSNFSLKLAVTTIDATIAAGDYSVLQHIVEGCDFCAIAQRAFTVSFWVKAFKTGTYCFAVSNSAPDRSYVTEYTISASNTWEYKTVTVAASPAAGTWNYTTGVGVNLSWTQACGSTFQTTANAWNTGNFLATANQVNNNDSTSDTFFLSQVQVTPGSTANPLQPRSFQAELAKCQRYYEKGYDYGTVPGSVFTFGGQGYGMFDSDSATSIAQIYGPDYKIVKRATPTMTIYDAAGTAGVTSTLTRSSGASNNGIAISATYTNTMRFMVQVNNVTMGGIFYGWTASADL